MGKDVLKFEYYNLVFHSKEQCGSPTQKRNPSEGYFDCQETAFKSERLCKVVSALDGCSMQLFLDYLRP